MKSIEEQVAEEDDLRAKFEKLTNSVGAKRLTACKMYVSYRLELLWRKYRVSRTKRHK
jgi:hypothetical protein